MGRVDDAMRRAAGQRPATDTPPDADAAALAREPFPLETKAESNETVSINAAALEYADVLRNSSLPLRPESDGDDITPEVTPADTSERASKFSFQRVDPKLAGKIVVDQAMNPVFREQYRRLAATLHQAQVERGIKVVIVVSAVAAEGKTLTASNLALTLSESYHRQVLLVDGDLRRPSLHAVLGVPAHAGLSEGLFADDEPKLTLHQVSPRLALLPAGRPLSDPMAGLASTRMKRIIDEARAAFDWVIVDTPPVALLPDGHLLAALGDGALLVVKAGGPAHGLIQRAIDSIGRDRILGVVLNKAELSRGDGYYDYRYDYRSRSSAATL